MCTKISEVFAKTSLFLEHLVAYFSLRIILIITHSGLIKNYSSNFFLKVEPHMNTKQTLKIKINDRSEICMDFFIPKYSNLNFFFFFFLFNFILKILLNYVKL